MDIAPSECAVRSYKKKLLEDYDIPIFTYKILEYLFRLHMKHCHRFRGYGYVVNDITAYQLNLTNSNYTNDIREIAKVITRWEQDTKLEFAFNKIKLNEIENHGFFIEEYKRAYKDFLEFHNRYKSVIFERELTHFIKGLKSNLKKTLSIYDRAPGKYLSFIDNGKPELSLHLLDYFNAYLINAYGVFGLYFRYRAVANKCAVREERVWHLIKDKILFECEDYKDNLTAITAKKLNDRLTANEHAKHYATKLLSRRKLVSPLLVSYLANNYLQDGTVIAA